MNKKVYIRGVKDRGREVIQKLMNIGAKYDNGYEGSEDNRSYFINEDDYVTSCINGSTRLNGYTEIFLDEKPKEVKREGWSEAFEKASEIRSEEGSFVASFIAEAEHPFKQITTEMFELWQKKNHDYGDSFSKGYESYGAIMPCIRIEDKFLRLKQLVKNQNAAMVDDERLEDTLIDLANYAVMTLMELRKNKK